MAIFASNLAPASTDRALGAVDVQRSLKFNSDDSAHLTRTPSSAGNRKTWTLSVWVKRITIDENQRIFTAYDGSNVNAECNIQFQSDGKIQINNNNTSSNTDTNLKTNRLFRDSSAWYHIVIGTDMTQGTASNRVNLYINGVQETSFSTESYGTQNVDWWFNNNSQQTIGRRHNSTERPFDGYMSEFNFIDGSQLDPSYFGFTESQTGMWMPKRYEGTYGTNGFYLDFSDNSSAAALGIDKSPNGNDFAPQSFSVSGTDNDSLIDTPTNNFPVLSNLYGPVNTTFGEANLLMRGGDNFAASTFLLPKSGKWYAEFVKYNNGALQSISVTRANTAQTNYAGYLGLADNVEYVSNGEVGNRTRGSTSDAPTWTDDAGVVVAVAVDMDNGAVYFARNNTYINSGVPTSGSAKTGAIATDLLTDNNGDHVIAVHGYNANNSYGMYANFGQRPFTYTPPAGYKSLCAKNIPPNVPSLVRPQKHFDTILYTGNGTSGHSISGLEFKPDFVWIKNRDGTYYHNLSDTVRGITRSVNSNASDAEVNYSNISAVHDHGFVVGSSELVNKNSQNLVAWCWKAGGAAVANSDGNTASQVSVNTEAGFSIVTYTGTGSLTTVGHGLNGTPEMILTKSRSATGSWGVLETAVNTTAESRIHLDDNGGYISYQGYKLWGDTVPTSSVFTVREDTSTNASGVTYVAYCWRSIPGYSKIGKYSGNGSSDGRFIYIGFRPAWVMFKRTDSSGNWFIVDSKRDPFNECTRDLYPNTTGAETNNPNFVDFLSNGFKLRTTGASVNSGTIIYMAFAEQPGVTPFDTFSNAR
tara:strand:+ start:223 stop:2655 length:2433 start_codon:yes stop_codon:yes gene_type:complete